MKSSSILFKKALFCRMLHFGEEGSVSIKRHFGLNSSAIRLLGGCACYAVSSGWFYLPVEHMSMCLGLTPKTVRSCIHVCIDRGIIRRIKEHDGRNAAEYMFCPTNKILAQLPQSGIIIPKKRKKMIEDFVKQAHHIVTNAADLHKMFDYQTMLIGQKNSKKNRGGIRGWIDSNRVCYFSKVLEWFRV
jgi:hypothetical protein